MERGKHRDEWKKLCETRIEDAEVLLRNGRYDAAYYLAGYAVECALKARIASLTGDGDFPPKAEYVRKYLYTHSLVNLLAAAELSIVFEEKSKSDRSFGNQWKAVKDWSEESRYDADDERAAAEMLASALGVVECIKQYWQNNPSQTEKS